MDGMRRESWDRLCLENMHADRDTKSLLSSSSSLLTPGKWPLVPISFSSEVKGLAATTCNSTFTTPKTGGGGASCRVSGNRAACRAPPGPSLLPSIQGWVTHPCSAWCPPSHGSPVASLDITTSASAAGPALSSDEGCREPPVLSLWLPQQCEDRGRPMK